jgi:hypothetical protein
MKQYTIGLPFSPSKRKSSSTEEGYHIKVSYGGGLGGANVDYYAKSIHRTSKECTCVLSEIHEDREIILNPRFVVSVRRVVIAKQEIINLGNGNMRQEPTTEYFVFPEGTEVWFSDASHNNKREDRYKMSSNMFKFE